MSDSNIQRLMQAGVFDTAVDPGNGNSIQARGHVSVTPLVSTTTETRTLSAPDQIGKRHTVFGQSLSGTVTVTVTNGINADGDTSLVFSANGDVAILEAINDGGTLRWQVIKYVSGGVEIRDESVSFNDSEGLVFGTGSDYQLEFDGTTLNLGPSTGMWANAPLLNHSNAHTLAHEFFEDFHGLDLGDADGKWTLDQTNGTAALGSAEAANTPGAGGYVNLTTGSTDNDFANLKLSSTDTGAPFLLASGKPMWFEARFMVSSVTDCTYYIGLCDQATVEAGADDSGAENFNSDGVYWRTLTGTPTEIDFAHTQNGTEAEVAGGAGTLAANTAVVVGFYFDGTTLTPYINGVAGTTVDFDATNFPDDQGLTPFAFVKTGTTAAAVLRLDYIKCIQLR